MYNISGSIKYALNVTGHKTISVRHRSDMKRQVTAGLKSEGLTTLSHTNNPPKIPLGITLSVPHPHPPSLSLPFAFPALLFLIGRTSESLFSSQSSQQYHSRGVDPLGRRNDAQGKGTWTRLLQHPASALQQLFWSFAPGDRLLCWPSISRAHDFFPVGL